MERTGDGKWRDAGCEIGGPFFFLLWCRALGSDEPFQRPALLPGIALLLGVPCGRADGWQTAKQRSGESARAQLCPVQSSAVQLRAQRGMSPRGVLRSCGSANWQQQAGRQQAKRKPPALASKEGLFSTSGGSGRCKFAHVISGMVLRRARLVMSLAKNHATPGFPRCNVLATSLARTRQGRRKAPSRGRFRAMRGENKFKKLT